jgi:hypothetical protein
VRKLATIEQPYCGHWNVSEKGTSIGGVSGDFVVRFVARDQDGHVLGRYPSHERAVYAVLHPVACAHRHDLVSPHRAEPPEWEPVGDLWANVW